MTVTDPSQLTASYDSIKLGIDAHAQDYGASRQVNGESVITRNAHPLERWAELE